MRILWVIGLVIPQASQYINENRIPFGGWVSQMVDFLKNEKGIELGIAMKAPVRTLKIVNEDRVSYYFLPQRGKYDVFSEDCQEVIKDFNPQIIHAEGTEQKYTHTFLSLWQRKNVVSLQGIINGYEPYEYGGLNPYQFIYSFNIKDFIFGLGMLINKQFFFKKRLKTERLVLKMAQNFLGRTLWDRSNSYFYNRKATYYSCNRILRSSFYNNKRKDEDYDKYSLFIGNSAQARKGAHFVFQALALLKNEYPEIKLYIAGQKFTNNIKDWRTYFGYRAYLKRLAKRLKIEDNLIFIGVVQEEQMVATLKRMHIYVMSSIIENSPNTLGEAMMLGVPCVASYNGGVSEMANDEKEALLYRDNDPKMLAYQIKRIFDSDRIRDYLTTNAHKKALKTHDPQQNLNDLINCYLSILK